MDVDLRIWLEATAEELGGGYRVDLGAGERFAWVSDVEPEELARCRGFAAHALRRVGEILPELDLEPPLGRWPVVLCASKDDLVARLARGDDDPDAAEAIAAIIPGGVWIRDPIGHFLMPHSRVDTLDGALAHELVHAALRDLPTPRWLEEGLATGVETAMGHLRHPLSERDDIMAFRAWAADSDPAQLAQPRDFWDPASSRHAYALAQVMVTQLLHDRERFVAFINCAHLADNGDAGLRLCYERSLADLVASVIRPAPQRGWLARLFHAAFGVD